jgi:hypothetical protein
MIFLPSYYFLNTLKLPLQVCHTNFPEIKQIWTWQSLYSKKK